MKNNKWLLIVLLTALLSMLFVMTVLAENDEIVASGELDMFSYHAQPDQYVLKWEIDNKGTMRIHGGNKSEDISTKWDEYCSSIRTIVICDDVDYLNNVFYNQFAPENQTLDGAQNTNLVYLEKYIVESSSEYYSSDENGCLLSKDQKVLISYPAGRPDEDFTIPEYITTISRTAFVQCDHLKRITIPGTVTTCEKNCVACCQNLETLVVNEAAGRSVDGFTYNCDHIKTWCFGEDVQTINEYDPINLAEQLLVDENNPYYTSVDGVLFSKNRMELIKYPGQKEQTTYVLPTTTKVICSAAFYCVPTLQEIVLPEGLLEIADEAFLGVASLETVVFPTSLERIGALAFAEEIGVPNTYIIKSMNVDFLENEFGETAFVSQVRLTGLSDDIIRSIVLNYNAGKLTQEEIQTLPVVFPDYENGEEYFYLGTIRCHAGSTAEAYAIEHNMDYELTHFFEGEWTYDWDNLVRWRKCIHCDERETEPLETENPGGAEIVGPADGDTSFDVEPVSTEYVLIQEALGEQNVVKAFDISLKNQDGVHVQPKGTVKVKLPGDFKTGSYKVYRVNADGTYTDMNAFLEGSHLVFYTDHFSLYVVVDESAPTEPDTPETPDTPAKESKVRFILRTVFEFLQKLIRIIFGK